MSEFYVKIFISFVKFSVYLNRLVFVALVSTSFGASGRLCFVIVAFFLVISLVFC